MLRNINLTVPYTTLLILLLLFHSNFFQALLLISSFAESYGTVTVTSHDGTVNKIHIFYGLTLIIFILAYFFRNKIPLQVNRWLLYSIVLMVLSVLYGLSMGWNIRDILADGARFIAPFIGYSVGLILCIQLSHSQLISLIYILGIIDLVIFYKSVFVKIIYVLQGGSIFEYAAHALEINSLYFFAYYFFLKNKLVGRFGSILIIGYLMGYILNPIFMMSKARTIQMLVAILLIFFFVAKSKLKLKIIAISIILISVISLIQFDSDTRGNTVFSRYYDLISLLETGNYHVDASTSFRIVEIKNVLNELIIHLPYSAFFGLGSGALYYESIVKSKGGVHKGNYRSDGGIHHVFMAYLSYLLRYGVTGLMFILLWLFSVGYYLKKKSKNDWYDPFNHSIRISIMFYIICSLVGDLFVPVYIYGNVYFGFQLALAIIFTSKSSSKINNYILNYSKQ